MGRGGKRSREKGNRAERELVELLKSSGVPARRIPLSGSQPGWPDDLIVGVGPGECRWEVKRRKTGFKRIYDWLGNCWAVAVRADHDEWLVTLRVTDLADLIQRARWDDD